MDIYIFTECFCGVTLSNFLEYWIWDNVDLVLLFFLLQMSRVLETRSTTVFSKKNIE